MQIILILFLLVAMGLVVFAIVRGLIAFANTDADDLDEEGIPRQLAMQNKMMFARVKWQAIAIAIAMLILAMAAASS